VVGAEVAEDAAAFALGAAVLPRRRAGDVGAVAERGRGPEHGDAHDRDRAGSPLPTCKELEALVRDEEREDDEAREERTLGVMRGRAVARIAISKKGHLRRDAGERNEPAPSATQHENEDRGDGDLRSGGEKQPWIEEQRGERVSRPLTDRALEAGDAAEEVKRSVVRVRVPRAR